MVKNQPNILVIMTDQQHANMMSCTGNNFLETPAMDSLASSGVRFTRAYCTDPVCIPSRFSLMTGRMPLDIGLRGNYPEKADNIPDQIKKQGAGWLLKEAGYDVAYGGKKHFPKLSAEDLGFDYITDDERDILPKVCAEFIQQDRNKPFFLVASFINPHDICHMAIRDFAQTDFDYAILENCKKELEVLDQALKFPEGVSEKDFFAKYCPPLPDNFQPQKEEPEAIKKLLELRPFKKDARKYYREKDWRLHRWAYCRLTERVDRQIGRLLKAVRENDKNQDTVIIFTSDHGDLDSAHKMEHKTAFYEEATNVPLIICDPQNQNQGFEIHQPVSNGLDLLPILCDYAGIKVPQGLKGISLRNYVINNNWQSEREYIPVQSELGFMIVTKNYKYQLYDEGNNREQLFNLKEDPGEMKNYAKDPEYADVLEKHRDFFKNEWPDKLAEKK